MKVEPKKYLYDMLDKARYLVALSHERSLDDMDSDRVLAAAVERELMIVGEACYLLNERSPACSTSEVPQPRRRLTATKTSLRCATSSCTAIRPSFRQS